MSQKIFDRRLIYDARDQLIDTVKQLNPHFLFGLQDLNEQQRYYEQGTNNNIAYTAWHVVRGLDGTINRVMLGKPEIWEAKGYRQKLSMSETQKTARFTHDEVDALKVEPWPVFLQYANEVLDAMLQYVNITTDKELETVMPGRIDSTTTQGEYSKGRILRGRLTHASMHSGEIYALRGALGLKGSPV